MKAIFLGVLGICCLVIANQDSRQQSGEKRALVSAATVPTSQPVVEDAGKAIRRMALEIDHIVAHDSTTSDPAKRQEAAKNRRTKISEVARALSGRMIHFSGATMRSYPASEVDPAAGQDAVALEFTPIYSPSANDPHSRVETTSFLIVTPAEATAAERVVVKRFDAVVARVQIHVMPLPTKAASPLLARGHADHVTIIARSHAAAANFRPIEGRPQSTIVVLDITGSMLSRIDSARSTIASISKSLGPSRLFNIVATRDDKTFWSSPQLERMTPSHAEMMDAFVKKVSTGGAGGVSRALAEAVLQNPDEIWLLSDGEYTRPEMDAVERLASEACIPIHTILHLDDGKSEPTAISHLRKVSQSSGGTAYDFPPK